VWAKAQVSLGSALEKLGERETGTDHLQQAVEAHHLALQEFTRERAPLEWAMTQVNMGSALESLGERESGTEHLQQAVDVYRLALQELTRERVPVPWAKIQFKIGLALTALGRRAHSTNPLKEALICFQQAGSVFQAAGMVQLSEATDRMISGLRDELTTGSPSNSELPKPPG
jgi:tetratricopeptide (TPR) repeat protein